MSSDSEMSASSERSENHEEIDVEDEEEEVVYSQYTLYEDEPHAEDGEDDDQDEEADVDGLSPAVLESRYERTVPVNSWCQCERCSDQNLVGVLEFRCCREVINAVGKLTFDGSIERISCITQHEDYTALTNRTVLLQVAPLLTDKDGRKYRRRSGTPENEFIWAVCYSWVIRWLCGYMGWENTRPLPACVYDDIRTRYQTLHRQARGYNPAQSAH